MVHSCCADLKRDRRFRFVVRFKCGRQTALSSHVLFNAGVAASTIDQVTFST
jgi:hypothetical protein